MDHDSPLWRFGRRIFGDTKRPVWLAVHALTGRRPQSTVEFFDLSWYGGYFEAPATEVQRRLPPGFSAVERRAGATELEIWCATYRSVDILRPYNELAVVAPVRFERRGEPALDGGHVVSMLVTTEEARWPGVENYGFPKIVGDIDIAVQEAAVACTAHQGGRHVLTLEVETGPTSPFTETALMLNVRSDGQVTSCTFEMSGQRLEGRDQGRVALTLGEHAIADQLRMIGLSTTSGRVKYVSQGRGVLSRATELGRLPEPAAASAPAQAKRPVAAPPPG